MTQYRVIFHKKPEPGAPFRWDIVGVVVSALNDVEAVETARNNLTLDSNWYLRTLENLDTTTQLEEQFK